jgi:glycosyltransferase involved in cell wall biosynthesis
MSDHPHAIAEASVIVLATPDSHCRWTGRCRHYREGELLAPPTHMAICDGGGLFYLYGCANDWTPVSETLHRTLAEAKAQAEYECEGVTNLWQSVAGDQTFATPPHSAMKTREKCFNGALQWRGNPYGTSGYAKLSRELATRLSQHVNIRLLGVEGRSMSINDETKRLLDKLRDAPVTDNAPLIRAFPPRLEHSQGRRICFTMMETQTVHPDFIRRLNHYYDECWTPTHWNRKTFLESGLRIPVNVVPLGVDPEVFVPGPPLPLPEAELLTTSRAGTLERPQGFLFITACQPSFRKGVDVLLEAFEKAFADHPEIALVIATTVHPYDSIAHELATRTRRSRIYGLRGTFSEPGLASLFRGCQAYVTTSLGEGWNLPLCEAAACGLPAIAGRHSAHAELFPDDAAFLLTPDGYLPVAHSEDLSPWFAGQPFATFGRAALERLVALLRHVAFHYSDAQVRGAKASHTMRTQYTWDAAASHVLDKLRAE